MARTDPLARWRENLFAERLPRFFGFRINEAEESVDEILHGLGDRRRWPFSGLGRHTCL